MTQAIREAEPRTGSYGAELRNEVRIKKRGVRANTDAASEIICVSSYSACIFLQIASAICEVPTAVGSFRSAFMS